MSRFGGDDLDDDFVPDDLVALSDPEDAVSGDGDEDIHTLLSADENDGEASNTKTDEKKRKRRAKEKERKAKVRSSVIHPPPTSNGVCRNRNWPRR
jgi:protein CMS1